MITEYEKDIQRNSTIHNIVYEGSFLYKQSE